MSGSSSRPIGGIPLGKLTPHLRSQRDYLLFVTRRFWPLAVGITGLAVAVVTVVSTQWGIGLSVLALVITLGVFIIDASAARRESSRYRCGRVVGLFPVHDVKAPLGYGEATYLAVPERGTMLVDAEADRIVQNGSLPVELDPTPYRLPEDLRRVAPLAIRTLRSGRVIFNGPALAMMDDLLPASEGVARPVRMRQTGYFMGICSSELCQYALIDQETTEETDLRLKHLVEPSGRLVTLASSDMANIVGISTLAFTTDDYLLMVWQSARNAASGKLLAPSGSGSLEPRDLTAARACATASHAEHRADCSGRRARADMAATSLQEVLRHGMERELSEETGVSADKIIGTRVLGFGRWLERGARPEFFAVTSLNIASDHPSIASIKPSESVFSEGVTRAYVDLAQLRQEISGGHSVENAPSCPPRLRESGSLPLLVGLRAVALYGREVPGHERHRNEAITDLA